MSGTDISEDVIEVMIEDPSVETTDLTFGGCPVIRVAGFFFIGDIDIRTSDPELTGWSSEQKIMFIHKGRFYTRMDRTRAFIDYFELTRHVCDEVLSKTCSATDKG
ncbi:hypothetical protein ACH4S8_37735 [Streptomyces sp. NPDC021080]|uniref:hypothetical protein n=1 Tax=Streptomyces sp. NPDC021080 TaxID=3365110 RepID=UPI0037ABDE24